MSQNLHLSPELFIVYLLIYTDLYFNMILHWKSYKHFKMAHQESQLESERKFVEKAKD